MAMLSVPAVLLAAALLAATMAVASRVPTLGVLDVTGPLFHHAAGEAVAPAAGFAPLRREFLQGALSGDLRQFFGSGEPDAAGGPGRGVIGTGPASGTRPGRPTTTTTTTTTTAAGTLAAPLPRFSELDVAMAADRRDVGAGDHITYTVTVTNVGTNDFRGEVNITSHHPFGTTDSSTPCGDQGVEADPDNPCVNPPVPVPGTPGEDVHTVSTSYQGPIPQGSSITRSFRVRVNPGTPSGTEIRNHAHLDVTGDGRPPETSNTVVVVVR